VAASASSGFDHSSDHVVASVIGLKKAYQGSKQNLVSSSILSFLYASVLGLSLYVVRASD
jgi:hypothetical protein